MGSLLLPQNKSMTATNRIVVPVLQQQQPPTHSKRKFYSERFQRNALFLDILLLNSSLVFGILFSINNYSLFNEQAILWLTFLGTANAVWFLIAIYNNMYKWYEIIRPFRKVKTLIYINSIFFSVLSSLYYYLFFPRLELNFLLPSLLFFMLSNMFLHLFFRVYYQKRMPTFKYIIVGGDPDNSSYIERLYKSTCRGKSFCLGNFPMNADNKKEYAALKRFIILNAVDKLLYINSHLQKKEVNQLIQICDNRFIEFEIIPKEFYLIDGGARIINEERLPTLAPHLEPLQRQRNKIFKRTFDILFSLLVILFVFPWLFPIIAILLKLDSRGPIFFLQDRTGYWNGSFKFIKFRSMTVNEQSNTKQASRGDARVTAVGAFLRKTSLDELPQFFNVLKGDMSVVGPRPHMIKHTEKYSALIDSYLVRHKVKPGITGWAQINGYRGPTETLDKMEKRVEFDVHYMKNWTLLMDVRCIIITIFNMIKGEENAV